MKKLLILLQIVLLVGLQTGCVDKTKTLKPLATSLADKLGRTSTNAVVELPNCGMTVCAYNVWFTTNDDALGLNKRFTSVLASIDPSLGSSSPSITVNDMLSNINDALSTTSIKSRLITTTGTYEAPSVAIWYIKNKRDELVAMVTLFSTRDTGVTYAYDGKSLYGNLILVQTLTSSH